MTTCTEAGLALGEPATATAPVAAWWLVVEQPGPWGRKALTESHLDPSLGAELDAAAGAHGGRVALVRRPRRHPDTGNPVSRRIWLASTRPGATWLLGGWSDDVATLASVPWHAVRDGERDVVASSLPFLRPEPDPLLLVCTNGRRDLCCATRGRELVEALRDRVVGRLWETTHLGGHRFAPTAVLLPHGVVHGRLDTGTAERLIPHARSGRLVLEGYRGRSTFSRPGQAGEAQVRRAGAFTGLDDLDVVDVTPDGPGSWQVVVAHRDSRRWRVRVREDTLRPPRPESCGAEPVTPITYSADVPVEVTA